MTGKKKTDFELHCSADVVSKNLLHNNKTSNQLDVKWEKDTFNLLRPDGFTFLLRDDKRMRLCYLTG